MTAQTDLALAAHIGAALDEIEQNDGAGPLLATRVLIRPVRQGTDPYLSETLTINVYARCVETSISAFGTTPNGTFGLLSAIDQDEMPLSSDCDHTAVTEQFVKKFTAVGWAQVPA